jgi:hypothetical protein
VKGQFTQPVQVRPQDVSVHLGGDPGDGEGDQVVEAPWTPARIGGSAKRTGRNDAPRRTDSAEQERDA